jgi:hypothetical protein
VQDRSARGPVRTGRTGPPVGGARSPVAAAPAHDDHHGEDIDGGVGAHVKALLGRFLLLVVPLLILAALAIGLSYVRLRHGPVTLKLLAGPIERGIAAELPGITAKIDDVIVSLGDDNSLKFFLRNLRLREADGDAVASASVASIELSGSALKSLRVVPSRVELIEPTVSLTLGDDGRLALSFAHPAEEAALGSGETHGSAPPPAELSHAQGYAAGAAARPASAAGKSVGLRRIDVARALADATARARQRIDAASYLREVGVRNATVMFDHAGRRTQWRVVEMSVDMEHRAERSIVSGSATVASPKGPWSLSFLSEDTLGEGARTLKVKSSIRGITPSTIAAALPAFSIAQVFDVPVSGDATLDLSEDGEIRSGELQLELGRGEVRMSSEVDAPLGIDGGLLKFVYDGAQRRVQLLPSTLVAGQSRATLMGEIAPRHPAEPGLRAWPFQIRAKDGVLAAEDVGLSGVPLDAFEIAGQVFPNEGRTRFDTMRLKAGGAEIAISGEVGHSAAAGGKPSMRLEGKISPMTADAAKRIWPRTFAAAGRKWFGQRVSQAAIRGGTLRVVSGDTSAPAMGGAGAGGQRLSLAIEAGDVVFSPAPGIGNVEVPRALVRVENESLEVAMPDASLVLAPNRKLPVKGIRFAIPDVVPDNPMGEVQLRVQAPLAHVAELIDQPAFQQAKPAGLKLDGLEGKVDAQFKVSWPLAENIQASEVKVEGKARVSDGRMKQVGGSYDIQGGSLALEVTEKAADAKGDMLVNGVPMKVTWQHLLDQPADKQPPLRITANLDNADRNQLGLDINDIVQGEVPVEVTVTRDGSSDPAVRLRADLTKAEMMLEPVAWRKPAGRAAFMQADIVKSKTHKIELQGFKVAGDDIAIEGTAAIAADNRMTDFNFPDFSLNVVSRLGVSGHLRQDNVWEVKAKGAAYDGRDFFRNVFLFGQQMKAIKPLRPAAGFEVDADIDTVIGFHEVNLRAVKFKLSKRGEKVTALDGRGTLDGGKPVAVALRPAQGGEPRKLLADSTDAGQAFKLMGFYPNAQNGRVRLEVNLDGRGPAEKTGTLWVEDFRILGDAVVAEVVASADGSRPAIEGKRGQRQEVREVFEFDRMRVPFSLGHGQFALEDSYVKGPLVGATIRGKADFNAKTINLGGTYVPLQGLNNVLGDFPLLGQVLSGPRGEGIFGITFAIQGAMAQPQVIVNPLALLTPGILRGFMELSNPDTTVRAVEEAKPKTPPEARVRTSPPVPAPAPAAAATTQSPPRAAAPKAAAPKPGVIDGWSSDTKAASPAKKN